MRVSGRTSLAIACAGASLLGGPAMAQQIAAFSAGDLVISTVSNSTGLGNNDAGVLDSASPITLQEFQLGPNATTATAVGSLILPQTASGNQSAISGEYGSASEGILQQSVNGQYLTILGYGVNANTFNTGGASAYGTTSLGQSSSVTGGTYATVSRVVGLIGANGSVDTSTALTGVFNMNNPRSVATVDGSSFYVSGQGASQGDATEGLFYTTLGATTATPIDNSTDTRVVSIFNNGSGNTLYVSRDVSSSNKNTTNISSLANSGGNLPTSAAGLVTTQVVAPSAANSVSGNNSSITVTANTENGVNNSRLNNFVYLSPEQYFFASPSVLYVTDSGSPKNGQTGKAAGLGDGGLQKWVLTDGTWQLDYDLSAGLNLVAANGGANSPSATSPGVTGLFGLAGKVVGGQVELFATSYGLNELSPSYLYEISDTLSDTSLAQASGESFSVLDAAAPGTDIRGVAFAPVPLPASAWLMISGLCALSIGASRRKSA